MRPILSFFILLLKFKSVYSRSMRRYLYSKLISNNSIKFKGNFVLAECRKNMKAFAVVRADDSDKVKIALHDMEHYGRIRFNSNPKIIEPRYADNLLVNVMGVPLKARCNSAALVELENNAGAVISKLRKIHPPAHIMIVSPRHEVYGELISTSEQYPEFDRSFNSRKH